MIGNDVEADINGATAAGLKAILVQTGKYRETDNQKIQDPLVHIANDIMGADTIIH